MFTYLTKYKSVKCLLIHALLLLPFSSLAAIFIDIAEVPYQDENGTDRKAIRVVRFDTTMQMFLDLHYHEYTGGEEPQDNVILYEYTDNEDFDKYEGNKTYKSFGDKNQKLYPKPLQLRLNHLTLRNDRNIIIDNNLHSVDQEIYQDNKKVNLVDQYPHLKDRFFRCSEQFKCSMRNSEEETVNEQLTELNNTNGRTLFSITALKKLGRQISHFHTRFKFLFFPYFRDAQGNISQTNLGNLFNLSRFDQLTKQNKHEKGRLGELITELTMISYGCTKLESKVGNHGFDGVFIGKESNQEYLFITESKCRNESKSAKKILKETFTPGNIFNTIDTYKDNPNVGETYTKIEKTIASHPENIYWIAHRIDKDAKVTFSLSRHSAGITKEKKFSVLKGSINLSLTGDEKEEFLKSLIADYTPDKRSSLMEWLQQNIEETLKLAATNAEASQDGGPGLGADISLPLETPSIN